MIKIFTYSCLLSALSIVEMKPLHITGHVGENVTIRCSDWNVWLDVTYNDKYFCHSPCKEDKDVIVKATFRNTFYKNRIQTTNSAAGLSVTFTNLQKSDSKTYYCGIDRYGPDSFLKVILNIADAETSSPKTAPKTVVVGSTLSTAVTNSSSVSSDGLEIITDLPTSYRTRYTTTETASATRGAESAPYLIIGAIVIITILMVLLKLMRKMKRQRKVLSSADIPQHAQEDVEYDEIRPEDQEAILYANYSYHQDTKLDVFLNSASRYEVTSKGACAKSRVTDSQCDVVYSLATQLPKEQIEPTGQSESTQFETENDPLYSLAQLPQARNVLDHTDYENV